MRFNEYMDIGFRNARHPYTANLVSKNDCRLLVYFAIAAMNNGLSHTATERMMKRLIDKHTAEELAPTPRVSAKGWLSANMVNGRWEFSLG